MMADPVAAFSFLDVLKAVAGGHILSEDEAERAFGAIMSGTVTELHLAAFLTALRVRGERPQELLGAVKAMRAAMVALNDAPEGAVDVCGTGGDGLGTLNVSTAVAFVLAGLGVPVAKHGGRALSSQSGATDVLEQLGIAPTEDAALQSRRLREENLAFLAAPLHHPAMRHALPVRRMLGFRTLFNLLGPLCNPARVRRQLVGVYDAQWCRPVAETLGLLGAERAWVVHGETDEGGSDELTLAGPARVVAWEEGELLTLTVTPDMAGLAFAPVASIRGGDARINSEALRALLDGQKGPYRDTVLFNAAVALHIAGRGGILEGGRIDPPALQRNVALAARSLDDGLAASVLARAIRADAFQCGKPHAACISKDNAGSL